MKSDSHQKTNIYKSKRGDSFILLMVFLMVLFGLIIWMDLQTFINKPFLLLPMLSPLTLMLWICVDTHYKIKNDQLICKSGFFKKKINLGSIKKIQMGKTMWAGFKMATALKGLIIYYNTYDDIYISPKNQKKFIAELLKINPEIFVIEAS